MSENNVLVKQDQGTQNAQDGGEQEIDLLELMYKLLENIKYIILAAIIGTLLAAGYLIFLTKPVYEATSKIYVMSANDSAINLSDLQIGSYLTKDYQEVFKTWEVHEMVNQELGTDFSYTTLQGMLTVSNPSDTRILYITAKSTDPTLAMNVANAYAKVARTYISETMSTEKPNILSNALQPTSPVSPSKSRTLILGFLAGVLVAAAVIVIRFLMDDKLKTAEDIRKYVDIPTLAIVPAMGSIAGESGKGKRGKKA